MFIYENLLKHIGVNLTSDLSVLDFGCGNGNQVKSLLDLGCDAMGCDLNFKSGHYVDTLLQQGRIKQIQTSPYQLPYPDNSFDILFSNQVMEHVQNYEEAIAEMRRVLKPDGFCIHMFPSRLRPIESHVHVPFSSLCRNYYYLYFWALLGVCKEYQKGHTPRDIAIENKKYLIQSTNYLSGLEIQQFFEKYFKDVEYIEKLYLRNSLSQRARGLARLGAKIPILFYLYRIFWSRVLLAYSGKVVAR